MPHESVSALHAAAEHYFSQAENRPFSMLEVCGRMGVRFEQLQDWAHGEDAYADLARDVICRVGAGWEKGELPVSLATFLHRRYLGEESARDPQPLDLSIRVLEEDHV